MDDAIALVQRLGEVPAYVWIVAGLFAGLAIIALIFGELLENDADQECQ